jgi:phenylacetate-CoA ligase
LQPPELDALTWDRSRIDSRQDELLPEVVAWAYEHSALIREIWERAGVKPGDITSRAAYQQLAPFVTAEQVRDADGGARDPFRGALCLPVHQLTVVGTTSGTTGLPQALPQHVGDVRDHSVIREYAVNGVGPGSRMLLSGNASRSGHSARKFNHLGAFPIFVDGDPAAARQLVAAAKEHAPTHWWVLTSPLLFALTQLERDGVDLADAFGTIGPVVWGGEPLGRANRTTLERWGLNPISMTSLGNVCAAVECPTAAGSHVWEDLVFVECLDVIDDTPVADGGRGELVVTSLVDRAAPILRYRSGDLVEFTREQCACGLHHGRIHTIGRLADQVDVGECGVLPIDVWNVVDEIPATAAAVFQIVRSKSTATTLSLRIGYDPALAPSIVALRDELDQRLGESLGVACEIDLQTAEAMVAARGGVKLKRVVDE